MVRRGGSHRIAERPGPEAVDDGHLVQTRQRRVVQVASERFERLVDAGAAQVQRRRDGPGSLEPEGTGRRAATAA